MDSLEERIAELEAQLGDRDAQLAADREAIAERDARLSERDAQIAHLLRQLFGRRSEKYADPDQHRLFTDGELAAEVPASEALGGEPTDDAPPAAGKRTGHKPRKKRVLNPALPRIVRKIQLPDEALRDPATGELLYEPFDVVLSETLATEPAKHFVIQTQRVKYRRIQRDDASHENLDGSTPEVIEAPAPVEGLPRCVADASVLAELMYAKFGMHLPFDRQLEELNRRSGIGIENSTVSRWAVRLGELCSPLVNLMRRRMLESSVVIQHDDSPVRQQPPRGSPRGSPCTTARFWSAVGQDPAMPGEPHGGYTVFDDTQGRAGVHVAAWLRPAIDRPEEHALRFIQCDDYAGSNALFAKSSPLLRVACWAHARRKWHDLRGAFPAAWQEAQRLIARLYAIEKRLVEDKPARDAQAAGLTAWHAARAARRAEEAPALLDAYFAWCHQIQAEVKRPKDARFKAAAYSLHQEAELRRYANADPAAELPPEAAGVLKIDNNACERSIRPTCIGKKLTSPPGLFTGSRAAGEAAAVMFSLIASATRHHRDPPKLGEQPGDAELEAWLPDRWAPAAG